MYVLFSGLAYKPLHDALVFMGYFGTFLAGLLYPYALTSAAGTGILLILAKEQNVLLAGVIAGIGALISDIILVLFVKHSFSDEVQKLSKETMSDKEPHQPHTLGAPSSQETPIRGAEPNQTPCPVCGKNFKTNSEMERHRDTTHHETKGHE